MRILHLIDIPWWSGLSFYAMESALAHRASGHNVLFAAERSSLFEKKAREHGIDTRGLSGRKFWQSPGNLIRVAVLVSQYRPHCIVAHTGSTHWIAVACGLVCGIPVVRTRCRSTGSSASLLGRWLYRQTRCTVTASRQLNREVFGRLPDAFQQRVVTLYPPQEIVDGAGSSFQKSNGSKRVGVLARLDPVKGLDNFLSAAAGVQKHVPDAEFIIAGSEENLKWSELAKFAEGMGLKNITYHGYLRPADVPGFIQSCSVGVIPSVGSEEISRALLEWFSFGRPVVATTVGCIPELLENGTGGFTVSPENSAQMSLKITELLKNPELAERMGQFNKRLVRDRFSREKFRSEWDKILNSL